MMKNILLLLTIVLIGCSTPQQDFPINYHPQKFKIDLTKTTQVITEKGLKINFNQEVINRIYGLTKTYNIGVQIHEFYSLEDFIFNNLETITTDGELLESAGMFKIDLFFDDNLKIDLKNAEGISLNIPYTFDKGVYEYQLFNGLSTENSIRWNNPKEITPSQFLEKKDTLNIDPHHFEVIDFISYDLENLNWINLDRFLKLGENELATVNITIPSKYEKQSVGITIPGTKSYISFSPQKSDTKNLSSNIKLPTGENISIVAIVYDGKNYFHGFKETVVGKTDLVKLKYERMPNDILPEHLKK